jgi:hypothetical protein
MFESPSDSHRRQVVCKPKFAPLGARGNAQRHPKIVSHIHRCAMKMTAQVPKFNVALAQSWEFSYKKFR